MRHFLHLAVAASTFLAIPATLHAEDAADCVTRAKAHLEKREFDKAIADCDKALDLDFDCAQAYDLRARAWIGKAGRDDADNAEKVCLADCAKSLEDCDEALSINPELADAYVCRACVWIYKTEYKRAVADCDKAIALDSKSAGAYATRAHVRVFTDEYGKVIADCDKALALDPKSADAYDYRSTAWLDTGEYDKALADCAKALTLDPTLEEAQLNRGIVWAHRDNQEKAIAEYKRALEMTPKEWRALNDLGVAHWVLAQKQDRMATAADAADNQETAKACHKKSVALKDQAKAFWLRGIAARPTASDILSNLGYAYSEANDLENAEYYLNKAVVMKPTSPRPHNNLGRILLRRSQQRDAAAREAAAKSQSDDDEKTKAESLHEEAGELRKRAIEQFEKAVELDPSLLEARLNLGEVFTQQKDLDKAESQYRAILDLQSKKVTEPNDKANFSQAYFGLARVAIARNRYDEATRDLQKAIELNPTNMAALQLTADQRYQRGEYAEGENCVRSWLAKLPPSARQKAVDQFVKQLDDAGKHEAAGKAREAAKLPAGKAATQ